MIKVKILFIVLGLFFMNWSYAHEPNRAFFEIAVESNEVVVKAEFPWTIREALMQYDSNFKNAKTKSEILKILFSYVNDNFKIKTLNDIQFQLLEVIELPNSGHTHGSEYKFIFKGKAANEIQNTLLFNLYENQFNHHEVSLNGKSKKEYKTVKEKPNFILKPVVKKSYTLWFLGIVIVGVIVWIVKKTI